MCYLDFGEYGLTYLITAFKKNEQQSINEDLEQGLIEAIQYEQGTGDARETTYMIEPVHELTGLEIRDIRRKAGMTQAMFAYYMGGLRRRLKHGKEKGLIQQVLCSDCLIFLRNRQRLLISL